MSSKRFSEYNTVSEILEAIEESLQNKPNSFAERNMRQVKLALTCEVNRHSVRLEYGVSDEQLEYMPVELVKWFIDHGGAEAFAYENPI